MHKVAGGRLVQDRRFLGKCRKRVDHRRQRFKIARDQLGGVFGNIPIFRCDQGNRLTCVTHLFDGNRIVSDRCPNCADKGVRHLGDIRTG